MSCWWNRLDDLVRALLPDLEPATLREAARLTGLTGLGPELAEQAARERVQAEEQIARLEPLADRDRLTEEIERLEEHRAALAPWLDRCVGHPRFARLLKAGYGTPRYETSLLNPAYYLDRQAALELETLCDMPFATVLERVQEGVEASLVLQQRSAELQRQIRELHLETQRREELRQAVRRLPLVQLERARALLRKRLKEDPDLEYRLRRR